MTTTSDREKFEEVYADYDFSSHAEEQSAFYHFKLGLQAGQQAADVRRDAEAFRLLVDMPSLWELKYHYGPVWKLQIAWGINQDIELEQQVYLQEDPAIGLRKIIKAAYDAINKLKTAAIAEGSK